MLLKFIIRAGVLLKEILGYFFFKPYIRGQLLGTQEHVISLKSGILQQDGKNSTHINFQFNFTIAFIILKENMFVCVCVCVCLCVSACVFHQISRMTIAFNVQILTQTNLAGGSVIARMYFLFLSVFRQIPIFRH